MKRSEFIGIVFYRMNEELRGQLISTPEFVDKMLTIIEEEGMLPPPKHPNIYADISNWESYLVWEDEDSINRFIWNQEDEKK